MTISLSNTTVNEATRGIQIGTLSGGSNYTVYSSGHTNYYVVNGSTLSLNANAFLDAESNSFIVNNLTDTNGRITASNYSQLPTNVVTIGYGSNLWQQFTLSVTNKNEAITVTPKNFQQNKYGASIAQVVPTDSYFSGRDIFFTGPSFLEISGNELKFTDDYYYSETGWVLNSAGLGWNIKASDYSNDLNFTMREGYSTADTDTDGDGNNEMAIPLLLSYKSSILKFKY